MSMSTTAALTRRRAEAKIAARAVLSFAPGRDTAAVDAARVAARRAAGIALALIEVWAEEERDRADAALFGDGGNRSCRAILAFEF